MKIVLMHGTNTSPDQKWYPWFAKEIKDLGVNFVAPILPDADDPYVDKWVAELDRTNPDQDTILVGHSRGGVAILRWLEKLPMGKKVQKVILIATNSGDSAKRSETENNRGFFTEEGYDFKKIKSHCDDFVVFHSRDDHIVPFEAGEENTQGLSAKFLKFDDRRHFGRGFDEIPELINEINL